MDKINWLAPLVEGGNLSIGRLMLWIVFGIMVYMWIATVDVPSSAMTAFLTLISYNFGKKARNLAAKWLDNKKAAEMVTAMEPE